MARHAVQYDLMTGVSGLRIQIDGVDTHYIQSGQGRDLLLLHGWMCDVSLFDAAIQDLSQSMRVTALDFPAQGQSARPGEPWGIPEYAMHTLHVLDALGIEHCDVIAHSFGARVATYLASRYPDRFGKLVFTGAAGIKPEPSQEALRRQRTFKRLRGMAETVGKAPFMRPAGKWAEEKLVQRYGSADYKALDPFMRDIFRRVVGLDLRDELHSIQSPTLLFWGDVDTETPVWMAEMMRDRIPDAGLVIAKGAGHYAYLEQSAFFLRVVRQFLLGEDA